MDSSSTKIGTFIDLRRNWAFKQIFGTPGNEDVLLALIQAVLPDNGITSVSLAPTERMSINENARSAVFDISCNTSSGDFVSVEMQFREQDDFNDRMVFYSSFPIFNSLTKGGTSYSFKAPIYIIGVLNFIISRVASNNRMLNCYRLRNIQDTSTELTRSLSYITVELPKFTKSLDKLETVADKIFYSLIHISAMEERPASFSEKVLVKLFELCRFANMTTEQQYLYIRTLMAEVDARSQRRTAINKAKAEALAEGKAEGKAEGIAEAKAEIARSLREKGISPSTIAEACGLTEEQLLAL
ncbi:MAG: Rpn family recombination-promoting nuclease/putative transposase [Bacteroidales bacterium]|nr:Rpn family recombination-promoting nuclease/putative transposase [Bacteroidales bacterium]